jgi:hypothetical protein
MPGMRLNKDVLSGLLFIGFGLGFLYLAQGYAVGTARRMGPAYFPILLSSLLVMIGLGVALRGLVTGAERPGNIAWRGLILVLLASVMFGALLRTAGLAPAVIVLVMVGAAASREFRWVPSLLLATALAIFCAAVFVRLLGLPLPILPWS